MKCILGLLNIKNMKNLLLLTYFFSGKVLSLNSFVLQQLMVKKLLKAVYYSLGKVYIKTGENPNIDFFRRY